MVDGLLPPVGVLLAGGGKIVGASGCSGATGLQDEWLCSVAAASINK
jgi:uncharacterized protein GlcG (DUF336 family)